MEWAVEEQVRDRVMNEKDGWGSRAETCRVGVIVA
jgi:hypothetical protein